MTKFRLKYQHGGKKQEKRHRWWTSVDNATSRGVGKWVVARKTVSLPKAMDLNECRSIRARRSYQSHIRTYWSPLAYEGARVLLVLSLRCSILVLYRLCSSRHYRRSCIPTPPEQAKKDMAMFVTIAANWGQKLHLPVQYNSNKRLADMRTCSQKMAQNGQNSNGLSLMISRRCFLRLRKIKCHYRYVFPAVHIRFDQ